MSMLPWSQLLQTATQLGLTPAQFWTLSILEWRALIGEAHGLDRGRLDELSTAFPDG
jgi:uncharacterized phage protein (TIGR02216 family)